MRKRPERSSPESRAYPARCLRPGLPKLGREAPKLHAEAKLQQAVLMSYWCILRRAGVQLGGDNGIIEQTRHRDRKKNLLGWRAPSDPGCPVPCRYRRQTRHLQARPSERFCLCGGDSGVGKDAFTFFLAWGVFIFYLSNNTSVISPSGLGATKISWRPARESRKAGGSPAGPKAKLH